MSQLSCDHSSLYSGINHRGSQSTIASSNPENELEDSLDSYSKYQGMNFGMKSSWIFAGIAPLLFELLPKVSLGTLPY